MVVLFCGLLMSMVELCGTMRIHALTKTSCFAVRCREIVVLANNTIVKGILFSAAFTAAKAASQTVTKAERRS